MNGIPQLMTPPAGSALRSAITLAQGAVYDFLSTETRWGIYFANTSYPVILGISEPSSISGVLSQATSVNGIKSLLNGELMATEVTIDSVVSVSQRKGSELSNYRIETGSFATFNKVEKPRQVQLRITKGGPEDERGMFLRWLDKRAKGYTNELTRYPRNIAQDTLSEKLKQAKLNIERGVPQIGPLDFPIIKVGGVDTPIILNTIPTKMQQNNLFDIYMPEAHYPNMTLVDYTITRESRSGANLIIANCTFQEVRQVTFQYSTTQNSNSKYAQDQDSENSSVQPNLPSPNALSKIKSMANKVTGMVGL